MNRVTKQAADAGIVVSVAAGNDDKDACIVSPASAGGASTSGPTSAVLTVAASNIDDTKALYSNWGSCVDMWAPVKGGSGTEWAPNNRRCPSDRSMPPLPSITPPFEAP